MAVTWRGSTVTPPIVGYPTSGGYVFALVNTTRSRSKINVLRFICMGDSAEISTTAGHIMPLIKTWRCACTAVTGGVEIRRRPAWDTAIDSPDDGIKLLYSGWGVSESNRIDVSARTGPAWEQFVQRACTTAEQRRTQDNSVLSRLTSVEDFSLSPGQALVVSWEHGTSPVGGSIFFNVAWEEDQIDAGFAVSGEVTLAGAPVPGAKVFILTDSSIDMPDPELSVLTTDGAGQYAKTVATGTKAAAFVQHRDGTDLYTDEGKPFIEGP
jgi:hypothetical protein